MEQFSPTLAHVALAVKSYTSGVRCHIKRVAIVCLPMSLYMDTRLLLDTHRIADY